MRNRFLALSALALGVLLLALFLGLHSRQGKKAPSLVALPPGAITRISARAAGWPTLVLYRHSGIWRVEAPVEALADVNQVAALVAALEEPVVHSYRASSFGQLPAGLRRPRLTLEVNGTRLEFGAINSATLLRYVRRGASVLTAMDYVAPMLQQGPWQFVSPQILPAGAIIETIRLPEATLRRQGKVWRIAAAETVPAPTSASRLAAAWLAARADSVEPYQSHSGSRSARIEIRLQGRQKPLTFLLQEKSSGTSLARPDLGISYDLDPATLSKLLGRSHRKARPNSTHARTSGS